MKFNFIHSIEDEILFITLSGEMNSESGHTFTKRFHELVEENECKGILVDMRDLEGRLSYGETYFLVHDSSINRKRKYISTALLDKMVNKEFAEFHETTSVNAGAYLKYFYDYNEAIDWLKKVV